jgi:site-specific DNA recombinase
MQRETLLPASSVAPHPRPIRADARARLVTAVAQGRRWLDEVMSCSTKVEQIALRERCSIRKVNMTISLAFLAPDLVKLQRQTLGLAAR